MTPIETWVLEYARKNRGVNRLDAKFHDDFHALWGGPREFHAIGACPCRKAMRALGSLYKQGKLTRSAQSVQGGFGWPKWVWVYFVVEP